MTSSNEKQPTGEVLQGLNDAVGKLVRQELELAKNELVDKARQNAPAVACLGGAAVLGAAAVGAATVTFIRLLDQGLPAPAAAALATAALGGAAAALAMVGMNQLRSVNPVPEETVRSLHSDVEAVTDRVRGINPLGQGAES